MDESQKDSQTESQVTPGEIPAQSTESDSVSTAISGTKSGEAQDWTSLDLTPPFDVPDDDDEIDEIKDSPVEPKAAPEQVGEVLPTVASTAANSTIAEPAVASVPASDVSDEDDLVDEADDEEFEDDEDDAEEDYEPEPVSRPAPRYRPETTRRRPTPTDDYPTDDGTGRPQRGYGCADVITALFLLGSIASCALTILLVANPKSPLNPFPVPTFPPQHILASPAPTNTPTNTFTPLPPTATSAATDTPLPTLTFTPSETPAPSNTPVVGGLALGTNTPVGLDVTPTLRFTPSPFSFTVDPVTYQPNTGQEACNWQSIAGTVRDLDGNPLKGLAIRVTSQDGNIDEVHYSGTEARYGESGFEVFLGSTPREDQYAVQLLGRTGTPISDTIAVQTHIGCKENVAVVNFVQNHAY